MRNQDVSDRDDDVMDVVFGDTNPMFMWSIVIILSIFCVTVCVFGYCVMKWKNVGGKGRRLASDDVVDDGRASVTNTCSPPPSFESDDDETDRAIDRKKKTEYCEVYYEDDDNI